MEIRSCNERITQKKTYREIRMYTGWIQHGKLLGYTIYKLHKKVDYNLNYIRYNYTTFLKYFAKNWSALN